MLEDPDSNKYIDGVAMHWYDDKYVGPSVLNDTHNVDPTKFMLYTEACEGNFWIITLIYRSPLSQWKKYNENFGNIFPPLHLTSLKLKMFIS